MSTGLGYFVSGKTYSFTVNVIDPVATGWGDITQVRLQIPSGVNIDLTINPPGVGVGLAVTVNSGNVSANADIAGTFNNFNVTFNVTFLWDGTGGSDIVWAAARNITASTLPGGMSDTKNVSYGVCNTIRLFNFSQNGMQRTAM